VSEQVTVRVLPACNICTDGTPAAYDAKTAWGPWANLCELHWRMFTDQRLGTGYGQRLILEGSDD